MRTVLSIIKFNVKSYEKDAVGWGLNKKDAKVIVQDFITHFRDHYKDLDALCYYDTTHMVFAKVMLEIMVRKQIKNKK